MDPIATLQDDSAQIYQLSSTNYQPLSSLFFACLIT